jgi:hypothetical protein
MQKLIKEYKIVPDISSWEYMVTLHAQCFCFDKALPIIGRLRESKDASISGSLAAMNISVAKAALFVQDRKLCRRCITSAETFLKADEVYTVTGDRGRETESADPQEASGGKRSWKVADESRQQSLDVFREHKSAEMKQDICNLSAFLSSHPESSFEELLSYFRKSFLFNSLDHDVLSDVSKLVKSLSESLGLDEVLRRQITRTYPSTSKENITEIIGTKMQEISIWFQESILDGFLCFDKIFGNSETGRKLPLKLEICSGAGEWACAQALKDSGNANWVTLELRHDRVYSTFSRAILGCVTNLCMLGGDAMKILPYRIPSESISALFVNHPGKRFK